MLIFYEFVILTLSSPNKSRIRKVNKSWYFLAPPVLTKKDMSDTLVVKPGATSLIDIPYLSVPPATVTWTINDKPLTDQSRVKPLTTQNAAKLTLTKVTAQDAGEYKVVVENKNGQVEFKVKVIVTGMN